MVFYIFLQASSTIGKQTEITFFAEFRRYEFICLFNENKWKEKTCLRSTTLTQVEF